MSTDLHARISAHYTRIGESQVPIDPSEVMDRLVLARPAPVIHGQPARPWIPAIGVAVAATVAVAALIAIPVLVFGTSAGESPATGNPVTTVPVTIETNEAPASTIARDASVEALPYGSEATVQVDTSFGRLTWTMYRGTGAGIPSVELDIDGYVLSGFGEEMLFSDDGSTWTTTPSATGLGEYRVFRSDGHWAVAGQSMWQSSGQPRDLLRSDGERWVKVELDTASNAWPEIPVTSGNVVLVEDLQGNFQVSSDGVAFRDVALPWTLPADHIDPTIDTQVFAAPDGGLVAYVSVHDTHPENRDLPDDQRDNMALVFAEVWTSSDGIDWTNRGLPSFLAAEDINTRLDIVVHEVTDVLWATVHAVDGGAVLGEFESTDGIIWLTRTLRTVDTIEANRPTSATYPGVQTFNLGYVDAEFPEEDGLPDARFWISRDSVTWEEIQGIGAPEGMSFGGASLGAVGDIIFGGFGGDDGAAIWVGHFEK